MITIPRKLGLIFLLPVILLSTLVTAQDSTEISVVGSGIVAPVFEALKEASGVTLDTKVNVTGTRSGFEQFCQGQADIANSNRPISADENVNCTNNNVDYTELLIAHNIIALIAPSDSAYSQCLTLPELNSIFAPSAQTTNWSQVNPAFGDAALTVVVPESTSPVYDVLNTLIEGDGLRPDATSTTGDADIIGKVSSTPGTIGVISYTTAANIGSDISIIQLNTNDTVGCQSPSQKNVEQRLYTAAAPLFVYVNRASLSKTGLQDLLSYMINPAAFSTIETFGFSAPTPETSTSSQDALAGTGNTRPFSEATSSFQIPTDVTGQVKIAGAASAHSYISILNSAVTAKYASLTTDVKLSGQSAGIRRLCNGEIDIAVTNTSLTDEQNQNCEANNIQTLEITLGQQAAIFVSNVSDSYLTCLTSEQLQKIWGASSTKSITTWKQVDPAFPDQQITLFAPLEGDSIMDVVLATASGHSDPGRDDIQFNRDPLYRAAATANVNGALALMSWTDYQKVLNNNQARIQLVAVNSGNGCIVPDASSINQQDYSLVQNTQLLVKTTALNSTPVQSFLWFMSSDDNFRLIEQAGYTGVGFGSLPALRQTLQKAFLDAAKAAAEATPEPTAEATPEATPAA